MTDLRLPLHQHQIPASPLVLGCMRFGGEWDGLPITDDLVLEGHHAVEAALEIGINHYDLADIYTRGKAEHVFGRILSERHGLREQIIIQSKCGIRLVGDDVGPQRYDSSGAHIQASVDGILTRLGVDYLDILLLHRPDPLAHPQEIGEALARLHHSGKVRHFGVSNMGSEQIRLLQLNCTVPLIVNQLEMSLDKIGFVEAGVTVNRPQAKDNVFPYGTMEYCQAEHIQLQAWGPLAQGRFTGRVVEGQRPEIEHTVRVVHRIAGERGVTAESVVLAWLMKHPAGIQPVIGSIRPERIRACRDATRIELTRYEWYELYSASCGRRM
ncbi:aldo/keto reductase [Paenibacillus xylanilyticus]|uniref:Aldo/keto reductase n=1 Tax=Paenibacillus xylanilyticus TaxID=248903 RepID=A0A7Y6C1M7_9BACL|nr:aldo/keto reductase [Paenibacillus xylanilyticus]NUU78944.1 aldo/keto reductase [Paenibacillus xylanilyticus]